MDEKKTKSVVMASYESAAIGEAMGLITDMLVDPNLPQHIANGLKTIKNLLKKSPEIQMKKMSGSSSGGVVVAAGEGRSEEEDEEIPFTGEKVSIMPNVRHSLPMGLLRRLSTSAWTTTTSATGMPTMLPDVIRMRNYSSNTFKQQLPANHSDTSTRLSVAKQGIDEESDQEVEKTEQDNNNDNNDNNNNVVEKGSPSLSPLFFKPRSMSVFAMPSSTRSFLTTYNKKQDGVGNKDGEIKKDGGKKRDGAKSKDGGKDQKRSKSSAGSKTAAATIVEEDHQPNMDDEEEHRSVVEVVVDDVDGEPSQQPTTKSPLVTICPPNSQTTTTTTTTRNELASADVTSATAAAAAAADNINNINNNKIYEDDDVIATVDQSAYDLSDDDVCAIIDESTSCPLTQLSLLNIWDYPIFQLSDMFQDTILTMMAYKVFDATGLFDTFKIPIKEFMNFFHALECGYQDKTYHNRIHASDVLHGVYYMLTQMVPGLKSADNNNNIINNINNNNNINNHNNNINSSINNHNNNNINTDVKNEESSKEPAEATASTAAAAASDETPLHVGIIGSHFTPLELLSLLTAASMHDFDHPGRTNAFLVATQHPLAVLYNDRSVLENHHAASAWNLFRSDRKYDWTCHLDSAEMKRFRFLVIEAILATDLKYHFEIVAEFNAKVNEAPGLNWTLEGDRLLVGNMMMKMADINGPCKSLELHLQWTDRIHQEFFEQGDEEKSMGLPISPYMDRNHPQLAKLQDSFINHLVSPLCYALYNAHLLPGFWKVKKEMKKRESENEEEAEEESKNVGEVKVQEEADKTVPATPSVWSPLTHNLQKNHSMWIHALKTDTLPMAVMMSSSTSSLLPPSASLLSSPSSSSSTATTTAARTTVSVKADFSSISNSKNVSQLHKQKRNMPERQDNSTSDNQQQQQQQQQQTQLHQRKSQKQSDVLKCVPQQHQVQQQITASDHQQQNQQNLPPQQHNKTTHQKQHAAATTTKHQQQQSNTTSLFSSCCVGKSK